MEPHHTVSVVVPAYNAGATLARAIESALAQRDGSLEIVVADDGSTDETRDVARRYGARVRLVSQASRGAAAARNLGVRESRGEFVAFLDADDEFLPGRIEQGIAPMVADPMVGATFCRVYRQYADGSRDIYGHAYRRCRPFVEYLWPSSHLQTSGVTCRRAAVERVGWFDETLRSHDDLDLWIRIGEAFRIVEIAAPLAVFHETPGSYSKRWDEARSEADFYRVIERALTRAPDRYESHRAVIMADAHLHWGILYLVRGNRSRARRFLARSLRVRPSVAAAGLVAASVVPHGVFRAGTRAVKRALNRAATDADAEKGGA